MDAPSPAPRLSPWAWPLAALLLLAALFACRKDVDFDIGFHLKAGQWIVQHGAVPRTDSFTYTAAGHPYVDMLWLYEAACWGLDRLGGPVLLSIVHDLLILAAFALLTRRTFRSGAPPAASLLLLWGGLLCLELRFLLRPEVLSWTLFLLTLWLLERRKAPGFKPLLGLALVQVVWVNTEGLFILEWVLVGIFLAGEWLETRKLEPLLLKALGISAAASLLNPYLFQGLLFPLTLLGHLAPGDPFHRSIAEFQSPWDLPRQQSAPFFPTLPLLLYKALSLASLALLAATWRRRAARERLMVPVFFALSALSIRNLPFFLFAALPVMAASLRDLLEAPRAGGLSRFLARSALAVPLTAALLLNCARVATQAYYVSDRRMVHNGFGIDEGHIPVKAVEFLSRFGLNGAILNDLGFGAWLDWKGPAPVFADGRLEVLGPALYQEYLSSYRPGGLAPLLARYNVQLVLLDHMADLPWVAQLRQMPDWRLIYFDDLAAIYARKDYAPQFKAVPFQASLASFGVTADPPDSTLTDLAGVKRFPLADWMDGFGTFEEYPRPLMRLGTFAYENGDFPVARDFFLAALKDSGGRYYEIYYNLAAAEGRLGRQDLARLCYEKALELEPSMQWAREKLGGS